MQAAGFPRQRPSTTFLVERYVPASSAQTLAGSVAEVARICARDDQRVPAVRYLQSLYLPSEETCFCVFQAPSQDVVRAVNDQGRFALNRITSGVLITSTPPQRRKRS